MDHIIIWRARHREPHVDVDSNGFIQTYRSYEEAKTEAEKIIEQEGPKSPWYFDYQIFEEGC